MHVCTWLQTLPLAEINQTFKLSLSNPLEGQIHLKIVSRQEAECRLWAECGRETHCDT